MRRLLRTPTLLRARRAHRAEPLWPLAIGGGGNGRCGGERGALTQFCLACKERVDVPSVLLLAVFDELRRLVRLSLPNLPRFLSRSVFVAARRPFRVRAARLALATASSSLSLFVEQLRGAFPVQVEWGRFELLDDRQGSLQIGQLDARGDIPLEFIRICKKGHVRKRARASDRMAKTGRGFRGLWVMNPYFIQTKKK
jgi:hypothetical protein